MEMLYIKMKELYILDESYIYNFVYPLMTFGDEKYKDNFTFTEIMERINKYHIPYHDLIKKHLMIN